ncbi:HORMA domain containing protein [Babesia gibsoni]|uniref:HORMA domain containing protein n=1 Tax=Babesia gibsoni TaxID=33632 RepID=A0AAD8PDD8_BABGI|nr:HORMA domain containing protein [Babesia gibsoni]
MKTITAVESTNVLRNFLKVGVSSIVYLRNLFAESVFEDTAIGGLQLKRLTRSIPETAALMDWIDHGVFDAMSCEYLKDVILGIHNSRNDTLESYTFSFKYGDRQGDKSGNVSVQISVSAETDDNKQDNSGNNTISVDKEQVKNQTVQVLRELVLLAQSLSPLPESRYLSMKLLYYENRVPPEYEPQHFRNAVVNEDQKVETINVNQQVGSLETGHHNLAVDVRSTCYVDESITNCKTSARTFDTLTRRPVMSYTKPSAPNSAQRPGTDRINEIGRELDAALPQLYNRNGSNNTTPKIATVNRNAILDLLKKGYEMALQKKYISKECLVVGLGIDTNVSTSLIKKMIEYGYIDTRFVKGKGYM